jgi:hypothetical protein
MHLAVDQAGAQAGQSFASYVMRWKLPSTSPLA